MDISSRLKEVLLQIPSARLAAGGHEVIMICPYCGGSKTDKNARKFYVSLPTDDTPSLFHCYYVNCLVGGVTTKDKLLEWGVYDQETAIELTKYNKYSLSLDKNKKFKDSEVYKLDNRFVSDNQLSQTKLKYINNRLGINLSYNDLLDKKIVLNLRDLLDSNNISEYTRDVRIVNELDQSFIGFISQDNAFVNLKNLRPGKVYKSIDTRFVNYNIFGKIDNTQMYYTIPTQIDLANPNRIKVHVAEGGYDILSIYYNMYPNHEHSIYSAILGGGYLGICKHFIHTMKLINIEFHIFIDNDVDDYIIYTINEYLKVYNIPLYLHKNMYPKEKDFGVRITNIKEQISLIR